MTRSIDAVERRLALFFFAVMCMLIYSSDASAQEQPGATPLVGRLATVEPETRRITLIPEGGVDLVEVFVAEDGEVAREDRDLTLHELVIEVGRRVIVHYRIDGTRRIAHSIIVEPAGSARPRALAMRQIPPQS